MSCGAAACDSSSSAVWPPPSTVRAAIGDGDARPVRRPLSLRRFGDAHSPEARRWPARRTSCARRARSDPARVDRQRLSAGDRVRARSAAGIGAAEAEAAAQLTLQAVPSQVAKPLTGAGQAVHEGPHEAGLLLETQTPPQRWKPVLQAVMHAVPLQVATPLAGAGQALQLAPQEVTLCSRRRLRYSVEARVAGEAATGAVTAGNSVGGYRTREARVATRGDAGVRHAGAAATVAVVPTAVQCRGLLLGLRTVLRRKHAPGQARCTHQQDHQDSAPESFHRRRLLRSERRLKQKFRVRPSELLRRDRPRKNLSCPSKKL